ncbi:MAG: hypothetical protein ACOY4H_15515 [Thermodesulfobacteriota bacterium]
MKRWVTLLFPLALCANVHDAVATEIAVQGSLHYDWWKSDNSMDGSQIFVPLELNGAKGDFTARLLTAFTRTESDAAIFDSQSLSSVIDTKVNLSYAMVDRLPVNLLFGLDVNCPTGKTDLDEDESLIVRDPDLISVVTFGEGFNVNPNVSMTKDWTNWGVGLGIGFLWRGEYDYSWEFRNYDPGNITYVTGEVRYYLGDNTLLRLFGDYGEFSKDELNGDDLYRESYFVLIGGETRYAGEKWESRCTLQGIFRGKSEFRMANRGLQTESRDGYGDEFEAELLLRYHFDDTLSIAPSFQFLYVDDNEYPEISPLYIGTRTKYGLGCSLRRAMSERCNLELFVRFGQVEDEEGWLANEEVSSKTHSLVLQYSGRF